MHCWSEVETWYISGSVLSYYRKAKTFVTFVSVLYVDATCQSLSLNVCYLTSPSQTIIYGILHITVRYTNWSRWGIEHCSVQNFHWTFSVSCQWFFISKINHHKSLIARTTWFWVNYTDHCFSTPHVFIYITMVYYQHLSCWSYITMQGDNL